jgi:hypothetical protein
MKDAQVTLAILVVAMLFAATLYLVVPRYTVREFEDGSFLIYEDGLAVGSGCMKGGICEDR